MIKITYIVLKSIELIVFILVGNILSRTRNSKNYWKVALPAIFVFALVEGLRYGRMTDYLSYQGIYNSCNTLFMEGLDPLFSIFVFLSKEAGIGFPLFLVIQSALLIYACLAILEPYRKYAQYALPLFLPLLIMNENLTRWFMACSFLYLAFVKYRRRKYLLTALYLVAAQTTHNAVLPLIPLLLLYPLYDKIIVPRSVVLFLFIGMTLFSNITNATFIVTISDFLLNNGLISEEASMAGHLVHAEDLIQGEYLELGIKQKGLYEKIISLVIWLPIIWYGYVYANDDKMKGFYNIMALSIILSPLFSQVELLGRYNMFMNIFSVVIASVYYYKEIHRKRDVRFCLALVSLFLFMYPAISLIFMRGVNNDMLFIWDALPF